MALTGCNDNQQSGATNDINDINYIGDAESLNPSASTDKIDKLEVNTAILATGGASGPYNTIGEALATIYNNTYDAKVSTLTTGASVENLTLINNGKAHIALAMSDVIDEALKGEGHFSTRLSKVQQIAALYPNYVQVVTSKSSGITNFSDLRGKHVAVGIKDSGVEVNARKLIKGFGMSYEDMTIEFMGYDEAADALKSGALDAAFLTSGLPNSSLLELSRSFDLKLVSIDAQTIDKIAEEQSYFVAKMVPAGMYGDKNAIPTAAIANALVVNADMPADDVYKLTKTMFENVDRLRSAHPAAATITPQTAQQHIVAPIHPGAQRYYDEVASTGIQ